MALRGMSQANMYLGIFQDTKLTDGVYTRGSVRHSIVTMDALSRHRYGAVVFYWTSPRYAVEAVQRFRPNVVGFHLETGNWQWYIIGCSVSPDNTPTIESVVPVLKECPWSAKLLLKGDLNVNLA